MAQEPSVMDATNNSLEVILVRMEGKLDRMGDRMAHFERDIDGIRSRLHDTNNAVTPLSMLDLPARIRTSDAQRAEFDARLHALENVEQQRKGAAALARIIWAIAGAVGVGGAAAILRVFHVA